MSDIYALAVPAMHHCTARATQIDIAIRRQTRLGTSDKRIEREGEGDRRNIWQLCVGNSLRQQ